MGFFSWKTQDTNKSISNKFSDRGAFTVYMINPKTGDIYKEEAYEGYGKFGGKDYYELLAELNGFKTRDEGIDLDSGVQGLGKEILMFPILVEHYENWADFIGQAPENCEYQGYFYGDENEEN